MAEFYKSEQILSNENIEQIVCALTEAYFRVVKKNALTQTQFRLALEEILLRLREHYGTEQPFKVLFARRFGKFSIEFSIEGERREWQPWDEELKLSYDILVRLGVEPRYVYSGSGRGRNRILWESLVKEKKPSVMVSILIAALLAVAAGLLINSCSPEIKTILTDELAAPFFSKLTSIFSALATPLVFFAVVCGIVGIGDTKSFGKIGTGLLRRMLRSYLVAALFLGIGGILVYGIAPFGQGAEEQGSAIGQVLGLVLDIIPDNLFVPFGRGNDLQVIVVAVFVGVALLILGNKVAKLNDIVKDCSELVNKMMLLCCKLLPCVVFFGVLNLIVTSNIGQFLSIGKMILVYAGINAVFLIYMMVRAMVVTRTSMTTIFPKQLATLLINLATSSQVAALSENMKCCKEKFGIDKKLVDFGLPLGIVIYMPSGAIFLGLTVWGLSEIMGIPVPLDGIIRILFIGVVLAIAAPPIPGSAYVVLPVLFASCGVPSEAFPLGIIFGTIIGYLCPAFNGFNIQLELLTTAKKLGKLDESVLKNKSPQSSK